MLVGRGWLLAMCVLVGCVPAPDPAVGAASPSAVPVASPLPSPTTVPTPVTSGPPTVEGRLLFNTRPCCEPAYTTPLISTTIVATVLYCPSVPDLVGREYTFVSDVHGDYAIAGFPPGTSINLRINSHDPVDRRMTIGPAASVADLVVDGPGCNVPIVCPTTIRGTVFDTFGQPLDGVTITARIDTAKILGDRLFAGNSSDTEVVTSVAGAFAFTDAPTGATIRIVASKAGYATRQTTLIPIASSDGSPAVNLVGFGKDPATGAFDPQSALSALPQATATPGPAGAGR